MSEVDPILRQAMLDIVENQLRNNDPPETSQTLQRLLAAGCSREQAIDKIASAVVDSIWEVMHQQKEFDRAKFKKALDLLK